MKRRGERKILLCQACYKRHFAPRERCSSCQQERVVATRNAQGRAICSICLARSKVGPCSRCGIERRIGRASEQVCTECVRAERPQILCSRCGQLRPPKMQRGGEEICAGCYRREIQPRERCCVCARLKVINLRTEDGRCYCASCYQREILVAVCVVCRSTATVLTRTEAGEPICNTCFSYVVLRPPCGGCGARKQTAFVSADGVQLCHSCAAKQRRELPVGRLRCTGCGAKRRNYAPPGEPAACLRCFRRRRRLEAAGLR